MDSGEGWSYNSYSSDGVAWTEISSAPPVGQDGDSGERLFVRLQSPQPPEEPDQDFSCGAWLQAGPHRPLEATGTIRIELRADGALLHAVNHPVQTRLEPGQRSGELPWGDPVRLSAPTTGSATCRVSYTPS